MGGQYSQKQKYPASDAGELGYDKSTVTQDVTLYSCLKRVSVKDCAECNLSNLSRYRN